MKAAIGVFAASAALLAPCSAAAAGWAAVRHPSSPPWAFVRAAEMDRHGTTVVVWVVPDAGSASIQSSTVDAGGAWGNPVTIWSGPANHVQLDVELNAEGEGVAAWHPATDRFGPVLVSLRNRSGSWSAPEPVTIGLEAGRDPAVSIDPAGNATVVWHADSHWIPESIQSALRQSTSATWRRRQVAVTQSATSWLDSPAVAADAAGVTTALWIESGKVFRASASLDGAWSTPERLETGSTSLAFDPSIDLWGTGEGIATWSHGQSPRQIWTSVQSGGKWAAPQHLGSARSTTYWDAIAARDGAHIVYDTMTDRGGEVQASFHPYAGVEWHPPVTLTSHPGHATFQTPRVTEGEDGVLLASWVETLTTSRVFAARRGGHGVWEPPGRVSQGPESAFGPYPVLGAGGRRYVLMHRSQGIASPNYLELGVFDEEPPQITALSVPARVKEDETISVSVGGADRWSALEQPRWEPGTGAVFHGFEQQWSYAAPGAFTVRVTLRDVVGNETSAERTVEVTPHPVRPPAQRLRCTVPRLTGMTIRTAKQRLARSGCRLGKVSRAWSGRIRKGRIVRQRPRARALVARGSRVAVVVSRGRKPSR